MPLLTELDTGQIEKLDVPKVLQDNLVTLNTPSSHSMSQLMEDMDRWGMDTKLHCGVCLD